MAEQTSVAEQIDRSRDSLTRASIEVARAMRDLDDLRRQADASRRQLEGEKRAATQEYYRLAGRVLEALGDLDAAQAGNAMPDETIAHLRAGLEDAIAREGIARVPVTEGVFNPATHEVVETVPDDARPEGTIVRVARPGYARGPVVLAKPGVVVTRRKGG